MELIWWHTDGAMADYTATRQGSSREAGKDPVFYSAATKGKTN